MLPLLDKLHLAVNACANCGHENADDARFCAACGSSLVLQCAGCGAELPAEARFCPACGASVATEPDRPGAERKVVTILFADVTGSTSIGERLDPERLQDIMGTFFSAMREEIEAEGGTVEKYIGDAVMAVFGVPAAHEDDPARALRAGSRMIRRLEDVNVELRKAHQIQLGIRIGINTGEVLAAVNSREGEGMVTGDAVNVAARLEQTAEAGQILTSERTARATRGFRFSSRRAVSLKGKDQPFLALALVDEPGGLERGVPGLRAPMVGRDRELELLRSLFERAATDGHPDLVTVYGDPGVGKSRLVREFLEWAESRDPRPTIVGGRCLPYGEGVTYWPFAEILKTYARVLDSDTPQTTLQKIRDAGAELLTADTSADPRRTTGALAYTVGIDDPEASFRDVEPRQVRAEIHAAWRSFFSALAAPAPVVAVVEDIHWADPALLDLLQELAERVHGGVVFLCPARPELVDRRPGWGGGRRNFSSIALEPLGEREAGRLVSLLLTVEDLPEPVHRRILERAEGNPFFLEEILRRLIDGGSIVHRGDRWGASADIHEVEIPDTVQGVLAARIDLLEPNHKRTLQCAAVVGRVFWPAPVGLLLNGGSADLDESLERLTERDLVIERLGSAIAGEPEFIFKHILTRDVAYESLPRRDRAHAHAAVAEWIERTAGERRREFAQLLAYHFEEAFLGEREDARGDEARVDALRDLAFRALRDASEEARSRYALDQASRFIERALALASSPLERAIALEGVGTIARDDYRGDEAWIALKEAADLRARHAADDPLAIARVCALAVDVPMRWPGSMRQVPTEQEVRAYLDLGFASAGDAETVELARLLAARSSSPFAFSLKRPISDREHIEAQGDGRRGADIAMRLGHPELASAALDGATGSTAAQGMYGSAIPLMQRRMDLVEVLRDPWEIGDIYAMWTWTWALIGDYPEAVRVADEGTERVEAEAPGMAIHALAWASLAEFSIGNWQRVVGEFLPRVQARLGDRKEDPPYFVAHAYGAAAFIHDAIGSVEAARSVALLRRLASAEGRTFTVLDWLAWIDARNGRFEEALECIEEVSTMPTDVSRPFDDQVRATVFSEARMWDEAANLLPASRAYAREAGLRALPVHLDRLEGRIAFAGGDAERAIRLLAAAGDAFDALAAPWERACTDLWLAEALFAEGRRNDARVRVDGAAPVFERLGSLREIEHSRDLFGRLG